MIIKILAEGGNMKPGPTLAQKIGPLGINMNEVLQKINNATKNFEGLKVPVELDVNTSTKDIKVEVFSPPVSELLKRELGIEKGSGEHKKTKVANASIEQIIKISKTKFPNLLCKDLKSAVKTIIGTCISLGILIENKSPHEVLKDVNKGKYDKEIEEEKTETPEEKKKELDEYFIKIKEEQERIAKQEQAAKEAEEQAKTEEATKEKEEEKPEEKKEEKDNKKDVKRKKK